MGETRKFRQNLIVGNRYVSEDRSIVGIIVAVWPMEEGSQVVVRCEARGRDEKIFVPSVADVGGNKT